MYRYQIIIEYDGNNLYGFQIQKKGNTVQKLVQSTISKILKEKVKIIGKSSVKPQCYKQIARYVK